MIDAPASASARRYLSSGLPGIYTDQLDHRELPPWATARDALREAAGRFDAEAGGAAFEFLERYDAVLATFARDVGWPLIAASNEAMSEVRRAYRRFAVPREPFVTRWLAALEEVLDPTVTIIDSLSFYFDAELTPEEWVRMLLCWLGFHAAENLPLDAARRVLAEVRPAASHRSWEVHSLARARGTRLGLQRLLDLAFPDQAFEVEHNATFTESEDPNWRPPAPPPAQITVRTASKLSVSEQYAVRHLIEAMRPLQIPCRLVTAGGVYDIA